MMVTKLIRRRAMDILDILPHGRRQGMVTPATMLERDTQILGMHNLDRVDGHTRRKSSTDIQDPDMTAGLTSIETSTRTSLVVTHSVRVTMVSVRRGTTIPLHQALYDHMRSKNKMNPTIIVRTRKGG